MHSLKSRKNLSGEANSSKNTSNYIPLIKKKAFYTLTVIILEQTSKEVFQNISSYKVWKILCSKFDQEELCLTGWDHPSFYKLLLILLLHSVAIARLYFLNVLLVNLNSLQEKLITMVTSFPLAPTQNLSY